MIVQHGRPMYDQRKWLTGKIHDVAKRLGMDDPSRRDFMMDLVGENSCRDMSNHQMKKVLYALTHKSGTELRQAYSGPVGAKPMTPIGEVVSKTKEYILRRGGSGTAQQEGASRCAPTRSGRDERMPDEPVTIEQGKLIEQLFADIEVQNPGRLARTWRPAFCKRQCGRVWPQTRAQANKILEALKAMRLRGWHPKEKAL